MGKKSRFQKEVAEVVGFRRKKKRLSSSESGGPITGFLIGRRVKAAERWRRGFTAAKRANSELPQQPFRQRPSAAAASFQRRSSASLPADLEVFSAFLQATAVAQVDDFISRLSGFFASHHQLQLLLFLAARL